jgi:hypothetical protein
MLWSSEARCKSCVMYNICDKISHGCSACSWPYSVICLGKHPSNSKGCQYRQEEKAIFKIHTEAKLSFPETWKKYRDSQPKLQRPTYGQESTPLCTRLLLFYTLCCYYSIVSSECPFITLQRRPHRNHSFILKRACLLVCYLAMDVLLLHVYTWREYVYKVVA